MNATEAAKEIIRISSTAGLSKDVIDLLEKKLSLLTQENAMLTAKVSALEIENRQLRAQMQKSQPVVGGLQEFGGVFWKRIPGGFEKFPYCKQCNSHPVMFGQPMEAESPMIWQCSNGHVAPFQGRPTK